MIEMINKIGICEKRKQLFDYKKKNTFKYWFPEQDEWSDVSSHKRKMGEILFQEQRVVVTLLSSCSLTTVLKPSLKAM